jgi:hypothetical protein
LIQAAGPDIVDELIVLGVSKLSSIEGYPRSTPRRSIGRKDVIVKCDTVCHFFRVIVGHRIAVADYLLW